MKIFIDSAELWEIDKVYCCGILEGVTTNPTLIKQAVDDLRKKGDDIELAEYIKRILQTARGTPVSLEVTEFEYDKMVEQGRKLYDMFNPVAGNVYIKIPVNPSFEGEEGREFEGIKAIKTLSAENIPVNCTLVFTPEQAVMGAKAGAKFVSPYVSRLDDYLIEKHHLPLHKTDYFPAEGFAGKDDKGIVSGIDLIKKTVELFEQDRITCEVLAASIRDVRQMREAALTGAHIVTAPMQILKQLMVHYKSQEGMRLFKADTVPEYANLTTRVSMPRKFRLQWGRLDG